MVYISFYSSMMYAKLVTLTSSIYHELAYMYQHFFLFIMCTMIRSSFFILMTGWFLLVVKTIVSLP